MSNTRQKSDPSGTTTCDLAPLASATARTYERSSYAHVNACRPAFASFAAVVTTALESSPPERHEPTSTSARSRRRTLSVKTSAKRAVSSALEPTARASGSIPHQRSMRKPSRPTDSQWPGGSCSSPSKNVRDSWSTQSSASRSRTAGRCGWMRCFCVSTSARASDANANRRPSYW